VAAPKTGPAPEELKKIELGWKRRKGEKNSDKSREEKTFVFENLHGDLQKRVPFYYE